MFINGLLKEVEQAGLGVELSDGNTIGGLLFADDFVGVSNSEEELQRLINVAHGLKACKRVSRGILELGRTRFSKYTYLGVDYTSNGEHVNIVKCIVIGILT